MQNNTALKLSSIDIFVNSNFGTLQNNTALKHDDAEIRGQIDFGTTQNNTALKPRTLKLLRCFVIAPFALARLQL